MANAKTISFVDAVNKEARKLLREDLRTMMEPVRDVIGVLDKRTQELNKRLVETEKSVRTVDQANGVLNQSLQVVDGRSRDTEKRLKALEAEALKHMLREGGVLTPQPPDAA